MQQNDSLADGSPGPKAGAFQIQMFAAHLVPAVTGQPPCRAASSSRPAGPCR